jgi:perosamine synthetase
MSGRLAIEGGASVRPTMLPYSRHSVDRADEDAVVNALRSGWLTTGPGVERFEDAFARRTGARHAVAVTNGTAALHAAMYGAGVGPGDEVLVPTLTFAASANVAVYVGARPVFVDVDPGTLLIDPAAAASRVTGKTKAIVGVDFAGQPADWDALRALAADRQLTLIGDAAHALGAADRQRPVGSLADLTTFSLHPVKHITSGEGGVVTTDDDDAAVRMRRFRNHGITRDFRAREADATWEYEIGDLGYNYRLSDVNCALALSQLGRLDGWLARRRAIAAVYDAAFATLSGVQPLAQRDAVEHAYHLYVVRLDARKIGADRRAVFRALRAENIGVNVHYMPVHLHPYYRREYGTAPGDCPVAEAAYEEILTLPLFPAMTDKDVADVVEGVTKVVGTYQARSTGADPLAVDAARAAAGDGR